MSSFTGKLKYTKMKEGVSKTGRCSRVMLKNAQHVRPDEPFQFVQMIELLQMVDLIELVDLIGPMEIVESIESVKFV